MSDETPDTPTDDPAPAIDVAAVRADTPGCERVVHLNNCGASLPPRPVLDATIDYLRLEAEIGGYEAMEAEAEALAEVYRAGARLLNCHPDELAFTGSASEASWRAFLAVPLQAGDRVLIGSTEYVSNALALLQAAERGVVIEVVPNDEHGQIDLAALADLLDERVKLVCLTPVAMANGLVNPTAEVGDLVRRSGAYFLVDACQAVGQLPVDVAHWGCDLLSFTGRKFVRGPRGSGMLYVRREILDELAVPTFIDGRSATWTSETSYRLQPTAQRYELFECSHAAKVGFGRALAYADALGMEAIEARIVGLAERLRAELSSIDRVRVLDTGLRRCGIVSFDVAGMEPAAVAAVLRDAGINAGSPGIAVSRLDLAARSVEAVVRAGVHYFNTDEEIDRLVEVVAGAVG